MRFDRPPCELQSQALYFSAVTRDVLVQRSGLQLTVRTAFPGDAARLTVLIAAVQPSFNFESSAEDPA